jgi:preprotein translocase subunit SecF
VIQKYIYGGGAAVIVALLIALFTVNTRLDIRTKERDNARLELSISNTSIDALTKELNTVKADLIQQEKVEIQKQAEIRQALKALEQRNKSLKELEARLKSRKSETQCQTPKELRDAFSRL